MTPPSHLPPHNNSLGHPHAPAPSLLHPMSDMDWRFNSYMIVYMLEFPFSQIIPSSPSPSESKSPLYISVSFFLSCIHILKDAFSWFYDAVSRTREYIQKDRAKFKMTSQVVLVVKSLLASAGYLRDKGLILGLRRFPGGGHGNPLQYSCLENPHGQRSLAGYSLLSHKELDTTEWLNSNIFLELIPLF